MKVSEIKQFEPSAEVFELVQGKRYFIVVDQHVTPWHCPTLGIGTGGTAVGVVEAVTIGPPGPELAVALASELPLSAKSKAPEKLLNVLNIIST